MKNYLQKLALFILCTCCYLMVAAQNSGLWDLSVNSKSEKAVALFQQGIQAMNDVDFVKSTASFNNAIEEDPNFFMPYCMLATFNMYFGNTDEFKALAQKAIAIKKLPKHEAIMQDALKKLLNDPKSDLTENGEQLVKMYPKSLSAHQMLSTYQSINNDVEGVLQTNLIMLDLTDNDAPIYNMLGYSYLNLEEMGKAKEAFETYIKLDPKNPNVYDSMGDYFMAVKEYENAYRNFMKAHEINDTWSYNKAMKAKELMEQDAVIAVIERETQSYVNVDYKSWRDCYIQEEPYARLNSGKESWGGANSWAEHDSSMNAGYQNYTGEKPLPISFKNEDYKIRITAEAAWAVYKENWFDKEGKKTGWNMNTRFLEKQNGEWKISYVGILFADTYEQTAEAESEKTESSGIIVPEIPLENKYGLARAFMYNNMCTAINIAKTEGKTAEKYGILLGKLYKASWPEEKSFEEFAQDCIYHLVCVSGRRDSEGPSVVLSNQSENKIAFAVSDLHPNLFEQGEMWGTSFDELIQCWEAAYNEIAGKYKYIYAMAIDEDKVLVTISKK